MVNNSMSNYRKIYEQHYGPIPKDSLGRSMEVHHIDGDHSNEDISNLKLVTIEEHYQIHFDQGDYGACLIMSHRMNLSPKQTSMLSRSCQQRLVKNGKHHWLGPDNNKKLLETGKHPFLNKTAAKKRNLKRISEGTHNLVGSTNPVYRLIAAGEHHFQTSNPSTQKIQDGSHHFLNNHPNKIQVTCPHCGKTGGAVNMKRYHFEHCKTLKI
jgi:hypothetical protein